MAEQLGAYLVRKGFITQAQWDEAVKSQLIYGGSLGTNLVELGLMDLSNLGQALSDTFHIPLATDAEAEAVTAETLALLKPELARTHLAFPLALEGRRLRVAMADPQDPKHVDALAFATGMRIVPSVLPELRLFQLLEKRYGIPKPLRPTRPGQPKPSVAPSAPVATAPRPPAAPPPGAPGMVKPAGPGAPAFAPAPGVPARPPAPGMGPSVSPGVAGSMKPSAPPGPAPMGALPPRPPTAPGLPGMTAPATLPPRPASAAPPAPAGVAAAPAMPGVSKPLGAPPSGPPLPPGMVQRNVPGAVPPMPGPAAASASPGAGSHPGVAGPRVPLAGSAVTSPGTVPVRPATPGAVPPSPGAHVSVGTLAVARPAGGAPVPTASPPASGVKPAGVAPAPLTSASAPQPPVSPPSAKVTAGVAALAPLAPPSGVPATASSPSTKVTTGVAAPAPLAPSSETSPLASSPSAKATPAAPEAPKAVPPAPAAPVSPPIAPRTAAPADPITVEPPRAPEKPPSAAPPVPVPVAVPSPPAPSAIAAPATEPSTEGFARSIPVTEEFPGMDDWGALTPAPVSVQAVSAPVPPPSVETREAPAPTQDGVKPPEPVKQEAVKPQPVTVAPALTQPEAPSVGVASVPSEPSVSPPAAAASPGTEESTSARKPRSLGVEPMELPSEPAGEMEVSSEFDPSELSSDAASSWARRAIEVDFLSPEGGATGVDTAAERNEVPLASVLDFVPSWDPSVETPRDEASAQASAEREEARRVQLREAVEALQRATSRGELGKALLSYVRGRFPRGFLLGETFGSARVGRAYGEGSERPEVAALLVDLDAPSLLAMAAQAGGPVVSSVPESQTDEALFAALGESFSHLMAVPLKMRERAVGFMVVDGGPSPFGAEELEEMGQLLAAASEVCGRLHEPS